MGAAARSRSQKRHDALVENAIQEVEVGSENAQARIDNEARP